MEKTKQKPEKKEVRKLHSIRINQKTVDWLKKHGGIGPTIEMMVARCIAIEAKCKVLGEEIDESEFFDLTCRRTKRN